MRFARSIFAALLLLAGRTLSGLLQALCCVAAVSLANPIALAVLGGWIIGDILLVHRDGSGQAFA